MKSSISLRLLLIAALLFSSGARADDNFWFGVKAGTLGLGLEAAWRPIPWLDVRLGANQFDYDESGAQAGINYDATLSLESYYLTGNLRFPLSPFSRFLNRADLPPTTLKGMLYGVSTCRARKPVGEAARG